MYRNPMILTWDNNEDMILLQADGTVYARCPDKERMGAVLAHAEEIAKHRNRPLLVDLR